MLLTTMPAFTVILAHFFLPDEFLTRRKIIGVTLALGGAILLALSGEDGLPNMSGAPPTGYLLVGVGIFLGLYHDHLCTKTSKGARFI